MYVEAGRVQYLLPKSLQLLYLKMNNAECKTFLWIIYLTLTFQSKNLARDPPTENGYIFLRARFLYFFCFFWRRVSLSGVEKYVVGLSYNFAFFLNKILTEVDLGNLI